MLHSICGYHPYYMRNIGVVKTNLFLSIILVCVYWISYLWGKIMVYEKIVPMKSYTLPLICIILYLLYALSVTLLNSFKKMYLNFRIYD